MAGTKTWADGDTITAADLNGFVRDQWITICTSGSRPSTTQVGRTIFETDTLRYHVWDGTGWRWILGGTSAFAPTFTQSSALTVGSPSGANVYTMHGDWLQADYFATFATSGIAGNNIVVTLPVAVVGSQRCIGTYDFLDSGTAVYCGTVYATSPTTAILISSGNAQGIGNAPSFAVNGTNDSISMSLRYKAR